MKAVHLNSTNGSKAIIKLGEWVLYSIHFRGILPSWYPCRVLNVIDDVVFLDTPHLSKDWGGLYVQECSVDNVIFDYLFKTQKAVLEELDIVDADTAIDIANSLRQ